LAGASIKRIKNLNAATSDSSFLHRTGWKHHLSLTFMLQLILIPAIPVESSSFVKNSLTNTII